MLHSQDCTVIVRPQRSGTVVMRHHMERTGSTYIHLWLHGDNRTRTQWMQTSVESEQKTTERWWGGINDFSDPERIFSPERKTYYTTYFLHTWITIMFPFRLLQNHPRVLVEEIAALTPRRAQTCPALNPVRMYFRTYTVCACAYGRNLCTHWIRGDSSGESQS